MKSADLSYVAELFDIFRPSRRLFTGPDETACFGTAYSLPMRLGKPISFPGTGQEIPDEVSPTAKERIPDLLWPQTLSAKRLAA
jgi:flagellar biosynthesis protein FlhF